ncbi:hypothetical protein [Pallidibacillus thermolactis]|jgi:hypothetical protein|uniref:hypothetical protein n=1 Tax=Pallidibacillus thermolactis TaxID=251051 RepID=UPI0021D8172C|nr:hypothetical protein [Pallidibacillus thermolactis]MCU9602771.1 hypothetical protein [Pallidibacillus thermolactis subsp. kokeshiiformis]MED1674725.1 hypothetical protein [Pallidibacillus thermolactis subsp. kokeshiiformis]
MLNKNLVKVFAIIFSVAIVFTSISTPVKVLADSKTQQNYVEVMNSVTEIDDIQELKKIQKFTKKRIKNNKINVRNENLDYNNAKLYKVNDTSLKAFIVPIKSTSQKFHEVSNVTLFYNQEYKVTKYTELHVKESKSGTFQVSFYSNGNEIANKITEDKFTTAKEYKAEHNSSSSSEFQTMGVDFGGIADCLGLTWSVGAVLAAVCGTACVLTGGTACAICIGAYLGFDVSAVTGCIVGNIV